MHSVPRGLATLALLKTRFDEGRDHLGLFEPFLLDALAHCGTDNVLPADTCKLVATRSGLEIPLDTARSVLGRLARRDILRRDGGRFFIVSLPADAALDAARSAVEASQLAFAKAFREFAATEAVSFSSDDDALAAMAAFIAENKVPLLLDEAPREALPALDRMTTRVAARFIAERCVAPGQLQEGLAGLTEGMVLRDTLLLSDVARVSERFRGLIVALDTPILFAALGMTGAASRLASSEGLRLLREAGATTVVFDRTLAEMRRILAVYEEHLATPNGRLSLYPTDLTRYMLTSQLTPADLRIISTTLEHRLAQLSIPCRSVPSHEARYTLDEAALAAALVDPSTGHRDTPRIRHDVDCVAAVLTLRRGATATAVEGAGAVFCTSSGTVIQTVHKWYRSQGGRGLAPIVHQHAITSLAWLKRPAVARLLKVHELASVCMAALRPRRETWVKFIDNLRRMRDDGALSDDETVAIVASELTEPELARIDDDLGTDADTIAEVVERVRLSYQRTAEVAAQTAIQEAKAERTMAMGAAESADAEVRSWTAAASRPVSALAKFVAGVCFYASVGVVAAAAGLSVPGVFEGVGGAWKTAARVVLVIALVLGLYSQIWGPSLREIRNRIYLAAARRIARALYGREVPINGSGEAAKRVGGDAGTAAPPPPCG
jgi:hypothetical protein